VISNYNFTSQPLVINDNLFMAIRAVSDADAANANAIEPLPLDSVGLTTIATAYSSALASERGTEVSDCNISYSIGAIRSRGEEKNPDPWQAVADGAQLLDYYDALETALTVATEDYESTNGR
jgi:hypothetical protein